MNNELLPQITRETWSVDKVLASFNDKNPRTITSRQLESLRAGIKEYGLLLPVVINKRTNRLVGGHQKAKAAQLEGITEIEVNCVDIDEKQETKLMLALNKIDGKWDYQLLEGALAELSKSDAIALSGFNESDLIEIMADYEDDAETFEEFAERFSTRRTSEFVAFKAPGVFFTCSKSAYEALIQRLYQEVGVDDMAAGVRFFQMIGFN